MRYLLMVDRLVRSESLISREEQKSSHHFQAESLAWLVPAVVSCFVLVRARLKRPRSRLHLVEPGSRFVILEKICEYLK